MDILIPQALLFGDGFPACLAHTWLQLRSLAGEAGRTPPFSSEGLARLTGKSLATLYRHLRRLKAAGFLDWHCLAAGLQICFELRPVEAGKEQAREEAENAPDEGCKLTACATVELGGEGPVGSAPDEGRKLKACATGWEEVRFSILRDDSQICNCASLNTLTDSLIKL